MRAPALFCLLRTPGAPNSPLYAPVPESDIFCGLSWALSVIMTLADRDPFALGVNVTLIVQLAPDASVPDGFAGDRQVFVCVKSFGSAPAMAMLLIVSGVAPGFLSVTTLAVLPGPPTFTVPKLKLVALSQA